jgi:Flp pilus assembly protein CpaB
VQAIASSKLLSTRGGTIAAGIGAAVLAAIVLLVFLSKYRQSINESHTLMPVLVAKSLIEKGTAGDVIGQKDMFQVSQVAKSQLKTGAIVDPQSIRGRVAIDDLYPGQQLTAADFTTTPTDAVTNKLADFERAITLPLDSAHGMIGQVRNGDEVEILAGFQVQRINADGTPVNGSVTRPLLRVIVPKALVLQAPSTSSQGNGNNVVLKVSDRQAANIAFASDNGKVWILLRPRTGARSAAPDVVSLETLLLGVKPVKVMRSFGGH